jgi:hypothetical protein
MKKKFFCGVAAIAVATVAAWNVYLSTQVNNKMTDVMLANMEALAQGENNPWQSCEAKQDYYAENSVDCGFGQEVISMKVEHYGCYGNNGNCYMGWVYTEYETCASSADFHEERAWVPCI